MAAGIALGLFFDIFCAVLLCVVRRQQLKRRQGQAKLDETADSSFSSVEIVGAPVV